MTVPSGLPDYSEITAFAGRVVLGDLSEPERADVAALMMLLGSGIHTHAAVRARHPGDPARHDDFAACVFQLAGELFSLMVGRVQP